MTTAKGSMRLIGVEDCYLDDKTYTGLPDEHGGNTASRIGLATAFLSLADGGQVDGDVVFTGAVTFSGTVTYVNLKVTTLEAATSIATAALSATGLVTLSGSGTVLSAPSGTISVSAIGATTLTISGASSVVTLTATGLIKGTAGLEITAGTSILQAMTATTGSFTGAVAMSAGLSVSAGTTAVQALTATTGAFSDNVTMSLGTTVAAKAITATSLAMAGSITQSTGSNSLRETEVVEKLTASSELSLRSLLTSTKKEDSSGAAALNIASANWIVATHTGSKRTVTSVTGGTDQQEVTIYNSSAQDFEIALAKMVSGVALTLNTNEAARLRWDSGLGQFYLLGLNT